MQKRAVASLRSVPVDGGKLLRMRDSKLMTQDAFAHAIGASRDWVAKIETGKQKRMDRRYVIKIASFLGISPQEVVSRLAPINVMDGEQFERVTMQLCPYFDVKIPAGRWIDTEPREEPDGYVPLPIDMPSDAFCLRIFGECMEPDFPSGSVIVFVPVRDGEPNALQFEDGKPYYFEHSDGKATFKQVFYEASQQRYRLEPINPKCKTLYVPEQMKARMSRAVKMMKDVL
jgi:transcriptional regulator with XRE-family HTH domain